MTPLPTTLADTEPSLLQVRPLVEELARSWYLLTPPDMGGTPTRK